MILNKIQIYWPYSEKWKGQSVVEPIISFHPITNDTIGEGFQIVKMSNGKNTIKKIIVNDALAKEKPVWILNINDRGEIDDKGNYKAINVGKKVETDKVHPSEKSTCGPSNLSVSIGEVKFFTQYDGLFNGGPEFRFFNGSITIDGQGQISGAMPDQFLFGLSRGSIYSWVGCGDLWDSQWEAAKEAQPIAVVEEDARQSLTQSIGGTVKFTLKDAGIETTQTIGVQNVVHEDDDVIYVSTYDRCWYYSTAHGSFPFENRNGWNVHGATGQVKWTMPYFEW